MSIELIEYRTWKLFVSNASPSPENIRYKQKHISYLISCVCNFAYDESTHQIYVRLDRDRLTYTFAEASTNIIDFVWDGLSTRLFSI